MFVSVISGLVADQHAGGKYKRNQYLLAVHLKAFIFVQYQSGRKSSFNGATKCHLARYTISWYPNNCHHRKKINRGILS